MKILDIKLINYIGPYNGLGLNEIHIDLTKCKNKIVVIKGNNGCGKSELFNAFHVYPDPSDKFIPKLQAEKHLVVKDEDIIYNIRIIHGVKKDGSRETTKAYITKITPYNEEQLNPNGNISSYREILESELSLDPCFIQLGKLTNVNRGLADKQPSERKKIVNSILTSVEAYNNINKTMKKRSSVFKSMINSINSKISNIGEEQNLKSTLESLTNRLNSMMKEKDGILEQLASSKSQIKLLDPDGSIQLMYDNIYKELVTINSQRDDIISKINIKLNKLNIPTDISIDKIMSDYKNINDCISTLNTSIKIIESNINNLLYNKENEAKEIQKKTTKLESLDCSINFNELKSIMKKTEQNILKYKSMLDQIGISNIDNISREEFVIGLSTLQEIKETIDLFKSDMSYDVILKSIEYYKCNSYPDIEKINNDISNLQNELINLNMEHQRYLLLNETAKKLSMRPSSCNLDTCQFIKDAVDANRQNPEDNLNKIEDRITITNNNIIDLNKQLIISNQIIEAVNHLKVMIRNMNKHKSILNKLPITNILKDDNIFLDNVVSGYDFKEIDVLYNYIDLASIIEEYKLEMLKYNEMKSNYNIYESKSEIIEEIMSDIEDLNIKLNNIIVEIDSKNKELVEDKNKLSKYKELLLEFDTIIKLFNDRIDLDNKKSDAIARFNCIKSNIVIIKESLSNIDRLDKRFESLSKQIKPLIEDRDNINHGLKLLYEYNEELKLYNLKYDKIETIKKYSSPTSDGIQNLYIDLYMNTTRKLANDLITNLFNGKFLLGKFIINESEFRIPCLGNSIANDDISSMSSAEVAMLSMILSCTILKQSSTRYNILRLDEVDGTLDYTNRVQFLNMLFLLINVLEIEQCIMITHNSELDLGNCDVIQLKCDQNNIVTEGNIIYQY